MLHVHVVLEHSITEQLADAGGLGWHTRALLMLFVVLLVVVGFVEHAVEHQLALTREVDADAGREDALVVGPHSGTLGVPLPRHGRGHERVDEFLGLLLQARAHHLVQPLRAGRRPEQDVRVQQRQLGLRFRRHEVRGHGAEDALGVTTQRAGAVAVAERAAAAAAHVEAEELERAAQHVAVEDRLHAGVAEDGAEVLRPVAFQRVQHDAVAAAEPQAQRRVHRRRRDRQEDGREAASGAKCGQHPHAGEAVGGREGHLALRHGEHARGVAQRLLLLQRQVRGVLCARGAAALALGLDARALELLDSRLEHLQMLRLHDAQHLLAPALRHARGVAENAVPHLLAVEQQQELGAAAEAPAVVQQEVLQQLRLGRSRDERRAASREEPEEGSSENLVLVLELVRRISDGRREAQHLCALGEAVHVGPSAAARVAVDNTSLEQHIAEHVQRRR